MLQQSLHKWILFLHKPIVRVQCGIRNRIAKLHEKYPDRIPYAIWYPTSMAIGIGKVLLRMTNFWFTSLQMRLGMDRVIGYPTVLYADITNVCNLRCPLCCTGSGNQGRQKGMMSLQVFKKIVDDIGKYLVRMHLYNWGEPLLNPDVYEMISYAHKQHIVTYMSTNFTVFSEEAAEKLIASGLDEIVLSVDGASRESYSKYRIGGDFRKVIEHISILVNKKKQWRSVTPYITWQFLVFKHNEHEIEKAAEMARAIGVEHIVFAPAVVPLHKREEAERWLPNNPDYQSLNRSSTEGIRSGRKKQEGRTDLNRERDVGRQTKLNGKKRCSWLWTQTSVNWDGSISPCCDLYDSSLDFGTMADKPFKEVWNNEKYRASRRFFSKKKAGLVRTVCMKCSATVHQ